MSKLNSYGKRSNSRARRNLTRFSVIRSCEKAWGKGDRKVTRTVTSLLLMNVYTYISINAYIIHTCIYTLYIHIQVCMYIS